MWLTIVALFSISAPPLEWTCQPYLYSDGINCDCGCGAPDPDCRGNDRTACKTNFCFTGSVPVEGAPHICAPNVCGDGFVDWSSEVCDDGVGEGCDESCAMVTEGYRCSGFGGGCTLPVCGDGAVDYKQGEQCDDRNEFAGDGCDACVAEPGFVCWSWSACEPYFCGDGAVAYDWESGTGETCDDRNATDGDGCSAFCKTEDGWACTWDGCKQVECGDGVVARGDFGVGEGCDDGNTDDGDGCSASCSVEEGWSCDDFAGCTRVLCGDLIIVGGEMCDDGNTSPGDGCSEFCSTEMGWACRYTPGPCAEVVCGDGELMSDDLGSVSERCDDGNLDPGDGCDATCNREPGYICNDEGCRPIICGDGFVDDESSAPIPFKAIIPPDGGGGGKLIIEQCDDGNFDPGDGCSETCEIEPGWVCELPGAPCELPVCGDGILTGLERCDDGDAEAGDGCSEDCTREPGWVCRTPGEDCEPLPNAWVCSTHLFGSNDGCDCGCGAPDPDCASGTVSSCDYNHCLEDAPYPSADDPSQCSTEAPPEPEPGPEQAEEVEAEAEAEAEGDVGPSEDTSGNTAEADANVTEAEADKPSASDEGCHGGAPTLVGLFGLMLMGGLRRQR
jgi:cysteine-rich repeat protein